MVNAFPDEALSRFVLRDRDAIYGAVFAKRVKNMGIEEVVGAPRSPWQNPVRRAAERIDSARVHRSRDRARGEARASPRRRRFRSQKRTEADKGREKAYS